MGSQRRDSHLPIVLSSLKLSSAYNVVNSVTDPRVMRALLRDKLKTDVEKNKDQQVKPRDKQETPEERGEKQEGELRKYLQCRRSRPRETKQ